MNKTSGNEIQKNIGGELAGKGNVEFYKNVFMEMISLKFYSIRFHSLTHSSHIRRNMLHSSGD